MDVAGIVNGMDFGRDNSRVIRFCIMVFCCIKAREGQSGLARKVAY